MIEVLQLNKLDTNLRINGIGFRFYLDDSQYLYYHDQEDDALSEEPIYSHPVKEYAVDYDRNGNIGLVLLDQEGRFYYYYFNGQSWEANLLYHTVIDAEKIHFIDIKFSNQSPQIFFCWQDLSSPSQVSIVTYFENSGEWKKKIISRNHLKDPCKPYCLVRDHQYNLFLSFLTNNNMIYDLRLSIYRVESSQWDEDIYLSSCIYIKYFFVDILPDEKGNLYISWTDKNKTSYCIKYLRFTTSNMKKIIGISLERKLPITWFFQSIDKDIFTIIYQLDGATYYAYALLSSKQGLTWSKEEEPILLNMHPVFTKISHQNTNHSNYSIYSDLEKKHLFDIQGLISLKEFHQLLEQGKMESLNFGFVKEEPGPSNITNGSSDTVGTLRKHHLTKNNKTSEMSTKQMEFEGKKNIIEMLENEVRYLKEEVKKLTELNRKYLDLINEGGEKISQSKEHSRRLAMQIDGFHHKINVLEEKCKELESEKENLHGDLVVLQQKNQELKDILKEKEVGFLKKLFK